MQTFSRLLPAALGLAVLLACPAVGAQPRPSQTVLTVHWGSEDYPTNPVLDAGIREALLSGPAAALIGGSLLVLLQSALIVALLLQRSRRRHIETTLHQSQQRYALATAAGAVGVWDWNLETNDMYVDPKLKAMLGFDDEEIPNRLHDWGSRVHPDDAGAVMTQAKACIDGAIDVYEIAHRMVHKDGRLRWFLSRGSVIRRADGTAHRLVGTDTDITERKQIEESIHENEAVLQASHQQIQDLAGRLIAAQEAERSRIARDLHDDTSQQLAGLAIALSSLKRRVGAMQGAEELGAEVSSLQQRTIALAENVRHLSHDLHPSVLEHAGLVAALAAHCADVQRQQAVEVMFSAEGDFESTPAEAALCLYRITQEALRNVVAHAGARRADVRLVRSPDRTELMITDDGKGFDVARARETRRGLGLVSMNERVRLAGGTASITTELNKGTRVRVQIPANQDAPTAVGAKFDLFATSA